MLRLEAPFFVERIGGVVADVEMFYRYSSTEILFFEETKATSLLRLFLTLSQFAFYLFIYPSLSFNPINRSICDRSLPLRKREEWSVEELNFWINNRVSFVSINRRIFLSFFVSFVSRKNPRKTKRSIFVWINNGRYICKMSRENETNRCKNLHFTESFRWIKRSIDK